MPIRPENKARYPDNWQQIREVRLEFAMNCCEGSPAYPFCRAANGRPHPVTGSIVVLTIAHLDHMPEHNEPSNLRVWCQRCHNTYDAPHRAKNRKQRQSLADDSGSEKVNDMAEQQPAGLEPNDDQQPDDETSVAIKPVSTTETKKVICETFAEITNEEQKRTEANEGISALREKLVTMGFSKKAQAAVKAFLDLNERDQENFDQAVVIMRAALGKPVQATLDLVHSAD